MNTSQKNREAEEEIQRLLEQIPGLANPGSKPMTLKDAQDLLEIYENGKQEIREVLELGDDVILTAPPILHK